ncbi:MAG TPA: AAA family ATPase [Steroidobacteraceae bacterium]
MLNRLMLFRNVGLFDSYHSPGNLGLSKLTLICAENGRGKTTLSAILRSLATGTALYIVERHRLGASNPPHIVIDCDGGPPPAIFLNGAWNRSVPNIVVFDDTFVDENICSGLVIDTGHRQRLHEFIVGAQGVALNDALQEAVDEVETQNGILRARAESIPVAARGGMSVDDFCALQERTDIDDATEQAERNLAAATQHESIRTASGFDPFLLPEIRENEVRALLATELTDLNSTAAQRVQAHFARIGEGGEAWVATGMNKVIVQSLDYCPFCAQNLDASSIIQHYRAYFSGAYADLKDAISKAIRDFARSHGSAESDEFDSPAGFERAIRITVERRQFWSRFTDVPEIHLDSAEIARVWSAARAAVLSVLRSKQNRPLERLELGLEASAAIEQYEAARRSVEALSDSFQVTNKAIAFVREQAASGNVTALQRDVERLRAWKQRFSVTITPLCAEYLAEKAAKAVAEQRRDTARAALNEYRETIFPAYENAINEYLRRFNAGFRLSHVSPQNTRGGSACTYNVLINNQEIQVGGSVARGLPSFRNLLSAGDRNTLALAFFFASLDREQGLADKIIVIDDPVSSLDEHRSLTTVQELRRLLQRSQQVIILSHNKPFLCSVWDATDGMPRAALEIVRDGGGSTIRSWDVNSDMVTLHDRRHEILRNYVVSAAGSNDRDAAEALRPVLEAFCRVAYPAQYVPGVMLGQFRGICEQRVGGPGEILGQDDIDELRSLTEYANLFHHDTNSTWQSQRINDAELLDFAQRTLAFTRR